jgi:PIN domain nuclease of toxin-antitoxin system
VRRATLPIDIPRDRADRLIWATAVEHGWRLFTADGRLRAQDAEGSITTW